MFGLLFGTACLIGLIWTVRGGRRHFGHCGGRFGRHHYGHHGDAYESGGRRGPWGFGGMFMRYLFERLDTTPGQEKVIRQAVDDFLEQAHAARREFEDSRKDVARAFRAESFDAESMGEAFAKHDNAINQLRRQAIDGLAKIHEALDEKQRARVAELIEAGMGRRWHGAGPYRSWV